MKLTLIILIFDLCSLHYLFAQNSSVELLWNEYKKAESDSSRIRILNEKIGNEFMWINSDSAIYIYKKAIEISEKNLKNTLLKTHDKNVFISLKATSFRYIGNIFINQGAFKDALFYYTQALNMNESIQDKNGMASCILNLGITHSSLGQYEKALEHYQQALKINEEINNNNGISLCYTNIGVTYSDQGIFDKALENYFKVLKIEGQTGNKRRISACYSNIGIVYKNLKSYDKALEYYFKALKIVEQISDQNGMIRCYNNIGNIYYSNLDFENSMKNYQKALKLTKEMGDQYSESAAYTNIGNIYYGTKNYKKCLEYYLMALKIKTEIDDKQGIALLYDNIASLNISLADSSFSSKNQFKLYLNKAIENGEKANNLATEINSIPLKNSSAYTLMLAYKKNNDFANSLKFAELYITTKDSMFKEEKTKAIAEMETKYQSEKKQLEIEKLGKQRELDYQTILAQTAEYKKQRTILISFIVGFIIIITFSVLLFRLFLQKKKANLKLSFQNSEILQQKEEILTQRDEIEAQRDIVTMQKEELEEIYKEVTDSINYARRIQEAVLPVSENSRAILGEHFILFKPKDIVSGDFYWTTKVNNWLIIAVADCTGHGVPGAFMSMLGISFLNDIVRKQEVTKASQVLDELRKEVIHSLRQKGVSGEQKDGMDISLLVINKDTNECQWAGANNPLYIIKPPVSLSQRPEPVEGVVEDKGVSHNGPNRSVTYSIVELKGDKMPIAIYPEMKDFTNHEFALQKGDCVYLFTDGYADQFGGPKGRKFMYKQFKEILIQNSSKQMNEQKLVLENAFDNWKRGYEQIDDITVFGIRINRDLK